MSAPPTAESDAVAIPATYARALVEAVRDGGQDVAQLLAEDRLTVDALQGDAVIAPDVFGRLYQRAMRLLDDESLGMVSGDPAPVGTFRLMCLCLIHRPDLSSIVQRAGEFLDVSSPRGAKPVIEREADVVRLGFGPTRRSSEARLRALLAEAGPMRIRTSLYYWYNLLGWFAGRSLALHGVDFAFAAPSERSHWRALFNAPVRFEASRSALVMPAHVLALPNLQSEQTLPDFLRETPYRLVVPSFAPPTLQDRLRALFGQLGGEAPPAADAVASHLGMSVSTLRRRLAAEGTSWQTLKEENRRRAACRYVAETDLPINEIARLLGFDETSTFFRAFRRWTGTTPSRYRQARDTDVDG